MKIEDRRGGTAALMEKARRSLEAASLLYAHEDYDFSASRAYYAAFYAVQALLLSHDLTSSSHSGTLRLFNLTFVKSGKLPRAVGKALTRLFDDRQLGDYSAGESISAADAAKNIQLAGNVVQEITRRLQEEGVPA